MPTLLRLKEARQRGQVARSTDLSSALLMLGGLGILAALGPALVTGLTRMTATMLAEGTALQPGSPAEPPLSPEQVSHLSFLSTFEGAWFQSAWRLQPS